MRIIKPAFFSLIIFILYLSNISEAAAIKGKIVYKGKTPKLREIKMGADPICLNKHTDKVYPQTITLGPNAEMKNVFLHIVEGLPKKAYPAPTEPVVLTQAGCMYT